MLKVLIVVFLSLAVNAKLEAFSISETRTVGPCSQVGNRPIQWAPSGHSLAYFIGQSIMVLDSNGRSRLIGTTNRAPMNFVWLDDSTIAVASRQWIASDSLTNILESWSISSLHMYTLTVVTQSTSSSCTSLQPQLSGPFYLLDRRGYYNVSDTAGIVTKIGSHASRHSDQVDEPPRVEVAPDAIYLVNNRTGSRDKISNKPYKPYHSSLLTISTDKRFAIMGGTLIELKSDAQVILDTFQLLKNLPSGTTGCGVGEASFDSQNEIVAVEVECDDGHFTQVNRTFLYDTKTGELIPLASSSGAATCTSPEFAPTRNQIAFECGGVLHIANFNRGE